MKKVFLILSLCLASMAGIAQNRAGKYIPVSEALHLYAGTLSRQAFIAFPEVGGRPIQWLDSLRTTWITNNYSTKPYPLHAQPGEYFVFQTGVWAIRNDLKDVQIHFSDLKGSNGQMIASNQITCFNAGGINYLGKHFTKQINIPSGNVQALWIGVNVPDEAKGKYDGNVTVSSGHVSKTIKIQLEVNNKVLADNGFDEGKRLSKLAWLNSTVGLNNQITKGYIPVNRKGNVVKILGRSLEIADNGLPAKITTYFTASNQSISTHGEPVIDKPFQFIIEKEDGELIHLKPGKIQFTSQLPSFITWKVVNTSNDCNVICNGRLEYDGFTDYHLAVKAKQTLHIKAIRLEVAMNKDKAIYMMGLNKPGGLRPARWDWKWDTTKNQDDVWLGGVNGGLQIKWKADNYVLPLVNVYYTFGRLHLPPSWGNAGKGGVHIFGKDNAVMVDAYSGERIMTKGEEQHYNFQLLITPFKTINKHVMFGARYYHSGNNETKDFIHEADSLGADIITVHQGNDLYPFINYPYSNVNIKALKNFINEVHADHKRAKVYYTTRELTINLPEFWPFVSLNGEIIYPGPGADARTVTDPHGPDPWLLENMRERKYIPAWVSHFTQGKYKGMQDLSVITTPESRMYNFYAAGLDWMVHHLHIDGIYIDDCSLDRTTIQRARKILDNNAPDANIDMHSWNHFNQYAGWASCMNLYMSLFPYIDQLWIGEGRNYDTPPDYWLTEISGIPFGLPSQMLQGGGNPWRGMVYGMTNRAGWTGTPPDNIWKFWDKYDIKDKTMIGYWDQNNLVKVNDDSVKITVYQGIKESILAVGNFGNTDQMCSLRIDFNKLGYDKKECSIFIPEIKRYQQEQKLSLADLDHLSIPGREGYLIIVKKLK